MLAVSPMCPAHRFLLKLGSPNKKLPVPGTYGPWRRLSNGPCSSLGPSFVETSSGWEEGANRMCGVSMLGQPWPPQDPHTPPVP